MASDAHGPASAPAKRITFKRKQTDADDTTTVSVVDAEDVALAKLGYKNEFRREFGNLATISFACSIMGVTSSLISTYDAGPAGVVWCWIIGSCMCMTIGLSVAELCSAYPTSGGLYSASAFLVPDRWRAPVGWVIGWLSLVGNITGAASSEFGLARQIWAAYTLSQPVEEQWAPTPGQLVYVYILLLIVHGAINCLATRYLARLTTSFIFVNLGAAVAIVIALAVTTSPKVCSAGSSVR